MASKKRPVAKSSGRASAAKGKPAMKKPAAAAKRTARAVTPSRPKPAPARAPKKPQKQGTKVISKHKPGAAPATPRAAAKPADCTPVAPSRPAPSRATASRRQDNGPLTSSVGLIHGIPPYQAKAGEAYMNGRQVAHFRNILQAWKRELMEEVDRTVHHMQDEASNFPDPNDRATQESEFGLELRTRDRERKLLKKIDSALNRIEDGSYGYCEETGEEIGLRRLEARPVATLSVEAQERRELAERQFRDREDGF